MPTRPFAVIDRRAVPRLKASLSAELAFGTVLVPATVRDMSIMGCGVTLPVDDTDLPDGVGGRGILRLVTPGEHASGIILPVILRNVHSKRRGLAYGLEFVPLSGHQSRGLAALLETIIAVT